MRPLSPARGWWLLPITFALNALARAASVRIESQMQATVHTHLSDGALYFVQSDFITGACLAASVPFIVGVSLFFARRYPTMSWMAFCLPWIFSANEIGLAATIWLKTDHLFEAGQATTPWSTFESYAALKTSLAFWWPTILTLPPLFWILQRRRRQLQQATP